MTTWARNNAVAICAALIALATTISGALVWAGDIEARVVAVEAASDANCRDHRALRGHLRELGVITSRLEAVLEIVRERTED